MTYLTLDYWLYSNNSRWAGFTETLSPLFYNFNHSKSLSIPLTIKQKNVPKKNKYNKSSSKDEIGAERKRVKTSRINTGYYNMKCPKSGIRQFNSNAESETKSTNY